MLFFLRGHAVSAACITSHFILTAVCLCLFKNVWADTSKKITTHMEEVIVTGAHPLSIADIPRSVSVITREDIELSGAQNLPELLAREANITLTSFSGNAKFTQLDIRGSGDTSVSNVLTLIDGIKINTPDLSGTDYSIIPIEQIERVEVIRGANTVRYGAGASQGVINIISKKPEDGSPLSLSSNAISLSTTYNNSAASMSYTKRNDSGYREHSRLNTEDILFHYRGEWNNSILIGFKSLIHKDSYQLPGPLDVSGVISGDIGRKDGSIEKGFEGKVDDDSHAIYLILDPTLYWSVNITGHYRKRRSEFIENAAIDEALSEDIKTILLDSQGGEITSTWSSSNIKLTLGYSYDDSQYSRLLSGRIPLPTSLVMSGSQIEGVPTTNTHHISNAGFAYIEYNPTPQLKFGGGYRREVLKNNKFTSYQLFSVATNCLVEFFNSSIPGFDNRSNCPLGQVTDTNSSVQQRWDSEAFELNSVLSIDKSTNFYFSYGETFRNPNADEIAVNVAIDAEAFLLPIQPQNSERYEIGTKLHRHFFDLNINFFKSITFNEILFRRSDNTEGNFSFSVPLRREGAEVQTKINLSNDLKLTINIGHTTVKQPNDKAFPLVAEYNAALNINWKLNDNVNLNTSTIYVDERFDGNDFNNSGIGKLDAYSTTSIAINFRKTLFKSSTLKLLLAATNIFDKRYISTAYSGSGYPAPGQQYSLGVRFDL